MNWYLKVLQNYVTFAGRARRKEYWMFVIFNVLITMVLTFIGVTIRLPFLGNIYSLAVLIPSIAVSVRRMHDTGKSGWYCLIPVYNLVLACKEGNKGENSYGPDPKADIDRNPQILHS